MAVGELPSGLIVREVGPSDSIGELTRLLHRAYAPLARRGLRYLATHQDEDTTRRRIAGGYCIVAVLDSRLVGTVTLQPKEAPGPCAWYMRAGVAWCEQLAVEPSLHNRGIGTLLMELVEERALHTGAEEVALDTAEQAGVLIAWYQRLGYRLVGTADWEITNYRSVVLSKRLRTTTRSP